MISIVSACRNEAAHIRRFLESVLRQEAPGDEWEIVIADGQSTDGTRAVLEQMHREHSGRIRVIENGGVFVSSGLNAAIRAARGSIIVRMDAHTEYAPDYVRTCVQVLEETGAHNVGGPARTRTEGWLHRAIAAAYHSRFACGGARFHDETFEGWVDTVTYGCWKRETLDRLGLFDEEMIRNQDDELNLRLSRAGGRIWQSSRIVSWYSPRRTLSSLFRQYWQYGFWKVAVLKKHRIPARWQHLVPGTFVAAQLLLPILIALAALTGSSLLPAWSGLYLAMNTLYFAATGAASVSTAASAGWDLLPVLPLVFAAYHLSYGLGFLWGGVSFGMLRRRGAPGRMTTQLTR